MEAVNVNQSLNHTQHIVIYNDICVQKGLIQRGCLRMGDTESQMLEPTAQAVTREEYERGD